MMNRLLNWLQPVFGILLLSVTIGACKGKPETPKPKTAPPTVVDILVASPQSVSNTVEANGTVVAGEYVELRPEIGGRLTYLNVPEGKRITQGTVIARINDADLRATLQKSKVQLQLAETTEQRYKKLLDVNGINQSDYDLVINQINGYKADMAYTQTLIDKTVIRAPFSGIVGLRQVSPGAFVTTNNILATIQQVDKIKIDFTLPEEYSNIIRIGSAVDVEVDAANKKHQKAIIIATEPQVNQATRNLRIRALLTGGTANPGAFVKVYLNASVDKKAILVPTNSIIPDDRNNQLILVKNGKATFVNVQTGIREANNVEITKGVSPGDSVVVTGVLFARPNSELKVRSIKTLEQLAKQ
jgi:membrane fusion protein, multidrug efflux system